MDVVHAALHRVRRARDDFVVDGYNRLAALVHDLPVVDDRARTNGPSDPAAPRGGLLGVAPLGDLALQDVVARATGHELRALLLDALVCLLGEDLLHEGVRVAVL